MRSPLFSGGQLPRFRPFSFLLLAGTMGVTAAIYIFRRFFWRSIFGSGPALVERPTATDDRRESRAVSNRVVTIIMGGKWWSPSLSSMAVPPFPSSSSTSTMAQLGTPIEGVAICDDGSIHSTGTTQKLLELAGITHARVIKLPDNALAIPGLNDAHTHLLAGASATLSDESFSLLQCSNWEDCVRVVAGQVKNLPEGTWIGGGLFGRGAWDHERWTNAAAESGPPTSSSLAPTDEAANLLPSRWALDAVTREYPVLLPRVDGHMSIANSLALAIAGITKDTADPPGGRLGRDSRGELTGILVDSAQDLVSKCSPPPSVAECKSLLLKAQVR